MIKVLIVDDHSLVRMGIKRLLDDTSDIKVIGDTDSGEDALLLVNSLNPDILLLDMKMPGMDGWEVTRRLKKSNPTVKIIVISSVNIESMPTRMLQLGVMGYLTKESDADEMGMAIRKVFQGEKYISAEIAQKIVINNIQTPQHSVFDLLSEREMQIVLMILNGVPVTVIAKKLFLSNKTVNGHRYRIFEKLGVNNEVELIFLAIKHQIVEPPFL